MFAAMEEPLRSSAVDFVSPPAKHTLGRENEDELDYKAARH